LISKYKAVEFYSATNDPKYEYYTQKIHATLKNPIVDEFLQSTRGIINISNILTGNTSTNISVPLNSSEENLDYDIKFKNKTTPINYSKEELVNDNRDSNKAINEIEIDSKKQENENAQNINIDSKEEVKSIEIEDETSQITTEKINYEQDINKDYETDLLKEKEKLIHHVPIYEEKSDENEIEISNQKIVDLTKNTQSNYAQPESDKNLKNESIGMKLVIVNDDDEIQKVDISYEESEEEDE